MISLVLNEIKNAKDGVSFNELNQKLGIERSALEGMIQHLVRTGRLVDEDAKAEKCGISGNCGSTCTGAAICPFVAKMPRTYSIPDSKETAVKHKVT